jgi:hypothetical protein
MTNNDDWPRTPDGDVIFSPDQVELAHLECGHCGSIHDVERIDLKEKIRFLCKACRLKIIEWV